MAKREGVMLAIVLTPETELFHRNNEPFIYVQPKMDGDRCLALRSPQGYTLRSSQGNSRDFAVPHVISAMNSWARDIFGTNTDGWPTLDGELYRHSWSHQQIRSCVSRTANRHEHYADIDYVVFDVVDVDVKAYPYPQHIRMNHLMAWPFPASLAVKRIFTWEVQNNYDTVVDWMLRFVDDSYEGVIVRDPDARYETKRSRRLTAPA